MLYNLKPKIISILFVLILLILSFSIYNRNFINKQADGSDAPITYGRPFHFAPKEGPYFGKNRGDNDLKFVYDDSIHYDFCNKDDSTEIDDEDAFTNNFTNILNHNGFNGFLPDIETKEKSYTLNVPINSAEDGDPVRGWIDFNGNGIFDQIEKAESKFEKGKSFVSLTWLINFGLQPAITHARIRTCKAIYIEQINTPNGDATTGEVEDYLVRIIKIENIANELRTYVNMGSLKVLASFDSTLNEMNKLTIGDSKIHFRYSGTKPDVFGINNLHEATMYGLRIGHTDANRILENNKMITSIFFDTAQENLSFKILDIDGGDRIKIEGFYEGKLVQFGIKNLTDNFYHQFNNITKEVYGMIDSDAGNDTNIPSSLDMAVEVLFDGMIDSVKLSYTDDFLNSSGTFTITDIQARRYRFKEVKLLDFKATEVENYISLNWKINNPINVSQYEIQRSFDGVFFETVSKIIRKPEIQFDVEYLDKTLPPSILNCYYKVISKEYDNHTVSSNLVMLKRNKANSLSGFTFADRNFINSIQIQLLIDMPGESLLQFYDYDGLSLKSLKFTDKKRGDVILLNNLGSFPEQSYYVEILNNKQKYLVQALKFPSLKKQNPNKN